jgi:hypothetical protein
MYRYIYIVSDVVPHSEWMEHVGLPANLFPIHVTIMICIFYMLSNDILKFIMILLRKIKLIE